MIRLSVKDIQVVFYVVGRGFSNSPGLFKSNFGLLKLFYQLCNLKNNTQYNSRKIVLAVDIAVEYVWLKKRKSRNSNRIRTVENFVLIVHTVSKFNQYIIHISHQNRGVFHAYQPGYVGGC